jgi:hypothetical protein
MVQAVSAIEALRAALAAGVPSLPWTATPTMSQQWAINSPNGDGTIGMAAWEELATVYGCDDFPGEGERVCAAHATYIAAACNAAPELLAELDKAQRSADHWHECFTVLEKAIVGDTAASAIDESKRLRAEVDRQREVIRSLNARCDHLGMSLRDIKAERDALRAALEKIADETAATWVSDVARAALKERT